MELLTVWLFMPNSLDLDVYRRAIRDESGYEVVTFTRESTWRIPPGVDPPDVLVVSSSMELPSATAIVRQIRQLNSDCRVIFLADREADVVTLEAHRAGAVGIVHRGQLFDDLITEIRGSKSSRASLDPEMVARAMKRLQRTEGELLLEADEVDLAILRRLVLGYTDQQISEEIHIAVQSVKNRVSRMLERFQKANRTQLAIFFERQRMSG